MSKSTHFSAFAETCERLRSTTKKLEKISILSEFLLSLTEPELKPAALFILGKAFPDYDPRTLNVSSRTLQRILDQTHTENTQPSSLTLLEVSDMFGKIAETSGKGSRKTVGELLIRLFNRANEFERKYLVKIIFGEMRIGVAEGVLLESIANAANVPLDVVRRANMHVGDPGEVAKIGLSSGVKGLEGIDVQLFRPVQPMLAELAEEFSKVFKEHGGRTSLEVKFDGARVQIHKRKNEIKVYSRHLTDVTASLPDLAEIVRNGLRAESAILEGEVVATSADGRPLAFQELMRRFRRVHEIEKIKHDVPIKLYLFDLLYLNGRTCIDSPYNQRILFLEQHCKSDILVHRMVTDTEKAARNFLEKALAEGHEGLMAKKWDSPYTPGSRGKRWFKIKPAETLDLVVIAADWGTGRREGWLSNYHLAALGERADEFLELGKTFKGLTDEQFKWMTQKLLSLKTREDRYTVCVKPQVVVEVAYNEIQRSPHYSSKFALRFARIKRIRDDKTAAQADTIKRVRKLYEKQFERKGKTGDLAEFK
ncbi:ATP-dependent DNA ligase [candidate division KSB1 bacterium]|nr:ATP-dependent DNA ligase [candidate division KSB1 bacterium]